mgnify:FL=1
MMKRFLLLIFLATSGNVSMSWGALCPNKCHCDDQTLQWDCTDGDLEGIPHFANPEMKVLKAKNNKISKLDGALGVYTNLEFLDLSENQLRHLGKNQFASCQKLHQLNISNNFLASLHAKTFKGLQTLQNVDLSKNMLTTLVNQTFAPLETLVELRLSHNKINLIEDLAFAGLSRLRVLYLDHNLMSFIKPSWLEPLKNLRFLYLQNNVIRSLPALVFQPLKALRILELKHNQIHDVSQEAFYGAREIDTLDLSENLLGAVPNLAFSMLKNLRHLDLSRNPIPKLDSASFSGMYSLRTLQMDDMYQLTFIDPHTFMDSLQVRTLSLASNHQLQPLPWGLFDANAHLEELILVNNSWSSLFPQQIPSRSLKKLHLSGIPFYCNCSLTWLWELYQTVDPEHSNQSSLYNATCQSVSNSAKKNVLLQDLKVDELACANWTFVLVVASISILVTVGLLIIVALIAYKCKQHYRSASANSNPCLHIKDDTMIYTSNGGQRFHQAPMTLGETDSGTYAKAILAGGSYSPPSGNSSANEPFYEVPRFSEEEKTTKSSTSSSKYSSSGYVGSELWENDFLGMNYATMHHQGHPSSSTIRSPRSSSGLGSSTSSSSSNGQNQGAATLVKPLFYSPARNFSSHQHHTLSANNSPAKFVYMSPRYNGGPVQHHITGSIRGSPKGDSHRGHQQQPPSRTNVYV